MSGPRDLANTSVLFNIIRVYIIWNTQPGMVAFQPPSLPLRPAGWLAAVHGFVAVAAARCRAPSRRRGDVGRPVALCGGRCVAGALCGGRCVVGALWRALCGFVSEGSGGGSGGGSGIFI